MSTDRDALLAALIRDPSGFAAGFTRRALPPGSVVDVPGAGPLYWVSDEAPTAKDMTSARAAFASTGMWPLLADGGGAMAVHELGPHGTRERIFRWLGEGRPSDPAALDPERWLAGRWPALIAEDEEDEDREPDERVSGLAPAGAAWPGLAPAVTSPGEADRYADDMTEVLLVNGWLEQPRMVLIPAESGSDALIASRCVLAEIDDIAGHAAVLGSWERRLGARVIALRHDTMFLSVAAAPAEPRAAAHIACEHFVFAPDNVQQNADSFPEYVESLVGSSLWGFWWD